MRKRKKLKLVDFTHREAGGTQIMEAAYGHHDPQLCCLQSVDLLGDLLTLDFLH